MPCARRVVATGLAGALLMATACAGRSEPAAPGADPAAAGRKIPIGAYEATDHGELDASGEATVEIAARDFYFEPTIVRGQPGQKLTVRITNEGQVTHNVSVYPGGIDENVAPGQDVAFTIVFPHGGQILYFCSFHEPGGMVGGLRANA